MRSIYVPLGEEVLQRLGRRARQERRHPKDTAALIIERELEEPEDGAPLATTSADRDDRRDQDAA